MSFRGFGDPRNVLSTDGDMFMGAASAQNDQDLRFANLAARRQARNLAEAHENRATRQMGQIRANSIRNTAQAEADSALISGGLGLLGSIGSTGLSKGWFGGGGDSGSGGWNLSGSSSYGDLSYSVPNYSSPVKLSSWWG